MRSAVAGISALVVFAVLQAIAKSAFAETLEADGIGRDIIGFVVLGGTFATFAVVYFTYSRRRYRSRRRR